MVSRKPYLLRAMHQWMVDSGYTPHIVVDANAEGVDIPPGYAQDGKIVLNVSYNATQHLELANEGITFDARFGGISRRVQIPMAAVLAVYAHETGQGMLFDVEEEPAAEGADSGSPDVPRGGKKPTLKVIK